VRHNLVQQIIKAYDEFASTPAGRTAAAGAAEPEPGSAAAKPANGKPEAAK